MPPPRPPKLGGRALDLFSGSGVVGRTLENFGFEITSLDSDKNCKPDLCTDILDWDYKKLPHGHFRLIAAGIPCTEYSQAKTTAERDLHRADSNSHVNPQDN